MPTYTGSEPIDSLLSLQTSSIAGSLHPRYCQVMGYLVPCHAWNLRVGFKDTNQSSYFIQLYDAGLLYSTTVRKTVA